MSRRDGKIQWSVKLPGSSTWSGPVLAGSRLWLASSTGQLVGVDATTGRVDTTQDLGQPVYIAPIVAGGPHVRVDRQGQIDRLQLNRTRFALA